MADETETAAQRDQRLVAKIQAGTIPPEVVRQTAEIDAGIRAQNAAEFQAIRAERSSPEPSPARELSNTELVSEGRRNHTEFQQLAQRYEQATPELRPEIRQELTTLAQRDQDLRAEYSGRQRDQAHGFSN